MPLILDVETTISNKGNAFDLTNKMVCAGTKQVGKPPIISWGPEDEAEVYSRENVRTTDCLVGFNIKFDIHWLRRSDWPLPKRVWDCQLAYFLMTNQQERYPSLDGVLSAYGFEPKLDVVKTEYWDKGIDTDEIPRNILGEYLYRDLEATEQVFRRQYELFQTEEFKGLYNLFKLQCQDLLVLQEMEYNGILFNTEKALAHAKELHTKQEEIIWEVNQHAGGVPLTLTNDTHLSALLYGGVLLEELRLPVGVYKTGEKVGQPRYKISYMAYDLPRLVEPLKGSRVREKVPQSELKLIEKGVLDSPREQWSVNEDTLKQLKAKKGVKDLISHILAYNKIEKLRSTYLEGWSKLIIKMNWEPNMIHGQLNQALVVTGRLSSSSPNLQNSDKATKRYCESRYTDV